MEKANADSIESIALSQKNIIKFNDAPWATAAAQRTSSLKGYQMKRTKSISSSRSKGSSQGGNRSRSKGEGQQKQGSSSGSWTSLSFKKRHEKKKTMSDVKNEHLGDAPPHLQRTSQRILSEDESRRNSKQIFSDWVRSIPHTLSVPDVVLMAMEKEKRKPTSAALCCPCYMVMDKKKRNFGEKVLNNPVNNIFSVFCTLFCLFGDDVVVFLTSPSADPYLQWSFLLCFFYFILDLVLRSSLNRRYVYTFMWWLDCAAIASLIPDIPLLSGWIVILFGLDSGVASTEEQVSLARAGRAARAGTRAGRIMKLMRLVRLVRLLKLFQVYRRKHLDMKLPDENVEGSHVGNKISALIELKVIFGVMIMILILPMLQYEESCDLLITTSLLSLEIASQQFSDTCQQLWSEFQESHNVDHVSLMDDPCASQFRFFLKSYENDLLYLSVGDKEWFNRTYRIGADIRSTHIWSITIDSNTRSTVYNMSSFADAQFNKTRMILDRTEQQQNEAMLSFLQTQIVILLLGIQAHLLKKDVDRLLVKPLKQMNEYVKPFMKKAMKEWAQTTMVNRKKPVTPASPVQRIKSFMKPQEHDDKESISTAIMMATIRSMKEHMSETQREEWDKREGKRKLWQSVRVMLLNKDQMEDVFEGLENIAEEGTENTTEDNVMKKSKSAKVHPS